MEALVLYQAVIKMCIKVKSYLWHILITAWYEI